MRYAITSVDNIYPLNTKTEVLDMINRFSNIKEYFKEEVAKNLYEVANEMNIMIPNNSEIYRFISLKNESVDKSNVFECEYYYVSNSELEEDSTFDDISKMSKSINKAIERSDIFKSNTSLNPNSDDGKSFTTNLYSCIKIDGNTFGFIKIALLNVIYYNRYTFNYEIIKVIDFDINSIYKSQTSNNLDEEIDIENDIDFYYLGESTELQKKTLKDSDYGIPELKKFPMHDKKHVLLAIKFFNTYVGTKYEKELADNINKKIIEFEIDDSEIHMTKVNQFAKYYKPYSKENILNDEYSLLNETQNSIVNMYHLSQYNLDNVKVKPSIPDNFLTKNGYEENKTSRVCFSKDIDGCLRGLSQNLTNKELYVNVPIYQRNIKQHIVHPTVDKVPDCKITKEIWITVPVKMKCIGKIKVLKDRGDDGLSYTYGKGKDKHTAELYDWDWIWIEKYNETSLDESLNSLLMEDANKTELANKVIGLFKDNGFNPKVSKKSLKDFIAGKESDIGGKSLCIAGLGNEYSKLSKTCSLINKEIKPLGAKISPDNYGTAFLKVLKEDTNQNNKWYYVASKKTDLKKGSVDEDLTYNNILDALKGSSLVHDLKMYHNEEFYNKEHTGYLYDFNSDESKEGPYTPYYKGEIKFTVTQENDGSDFYDWELIRINNESVEVQEIKPDNCPKCNSNNLQTYFKGSYFRIRCKDCKHELGKFSAEAVKNESSTAGVAVAPSIQGKSPYVNTYPRRDEENTIPEEIKNVKNVLDDFYSLKEKPNMLSESLIPNEIFNEHPIFADTKTLFGYDRVRLNKDVFERYTEEFKRLGFNQEGKIFNPKSDCGEIIIDKNKNIKACILINKDYVVKKLPYNLLYFIYVDDSICDEKHTKEVWLENLSNIAFNRYSCEFIEVDKSNKELIQYYVEDHYGFSVLDDNGKKLILTARTDLIETFNIVLTNNESLLNEEIESESKFNIEEYSLDKLGTSSGVYSKLGLWNPIVKIKGQNYRERCEAIIFNDNNEIFMGINVNRTRIPGGGTMPNIPIEEQLKEECREEVRINIKDINYIGCYKNVYTDAHKEIFDRRSDIENVEYEGALTYLFTAKYDSKYTGDINALDKDDLINEGRFYPISKVLSSNIKNEWKVAIINYLAKNSMNDSYTSLWNRMTLDTNFLELVENNDNSTIKTEAYNILTEEENSSKLKAKRNKIEKLIYTTFNLLDSTGKNAEKYKEHYKSLSDKDFFKEIQSMLDDNKKNFYLEILPNVNEPSLKAVKETADYIDLELDNYIYYRNDGDNNEPVRSSYKVPVGGLTIKRLRVKRFLRIIPQKKLYLYNFN